MTRHTIAQKINIGKEGYIRDNSYTFDINGKEIWINLAGSVFGPAVLVRVLSEPFKLNIYWEITHKHYEMDFITVLNLTDNEVYIVLNNFDEI